MTDLLAGLDLDDAERAWLAGHLRDYLRAVPSFTLFFVPEGLAFIDYVAALPVPELVHSVGRFERAMWLARFEPQRPPTVIEFAAPPDLVLGAALQGQPLPAPSAELHFIVVDPGVAGRWRIATADDVAALERSTTTWPPSP